MTIKAAGLTCQRRMGQIIIPDEEQSEVLETTIEGGQGDAQKAGSDLI